MCRIVTRMSLDTLLSRPVWVAPMAGGTTTVPLVTSAWEAGAFGLLAAGYKTPDAVVEQVRVVRQAGQPVGVNVFAPQPRSDADAIAVYAERLQPRADRFAVQLGEPSHDDDHYDGKIEALLQERPDLVTFTFGLPTADAVAALQGRGIAVGLTVTSAEEAADAARLAPDLVIAQAAAAGGHRGSHELDRKPGEETIEDLLQEALPLGLPVIAAGGVVTRGHVHDALELGASAVSCGTAFLLATEAGTSETHRGALQNPRFTETAVTRAFTGRWARALANEWVEFAPGAPAGYPELHHLTRPLRAAAAAAGDIEWAHLWAGTGWRDIRPGTTAEIVATLLPER